MNSLKEQCLKNEILTLFYYLFEQKNNCIKLYIEHNHLKIKFKNREKLLKELYDYTKKEWKWNSVWKRLHRLGFRHKKNIYSKYIPTIQKEKKRKILTRDENFKDKLQLLERFAHDIFENDEHYVLLEVSLKKKKHKIIVNKEKPFDSKQPYIPVFVSPGMSEINNIEFIPPWYLARSSEYDANFE